MQQRRKRKTGYAGSLLTGLFALILMLAFVLPLNVCAGNVTSGTLGDNGGIEWTYDADTKTLTVTGEDSGLYGSYNYLIYRSESPFVTISSDVEKIVMKDCAPQGSVDALFAGLSSLKEIELDNFDTSNVTDMGFMFGRCSSLTSLDVSGFDTSKVTDMYGMFSGCSNLTSLDVSGFDTTKVTKMNCMFEFCTSLTSLDVSGFDTSNVTDMGGMFASCSSLTGLDVSNFDTTKVTNINRMFSGCSGLTSLDVSDFDTTKVVRMDWLFSGCSGLISLDVSSFDTPKVVRMDCMFAGCSSLKSLDLSSFDTSNVTDMFSVFEGCSSLLSLDMSSFDMSNVINMWDVLSGCDSLEAIYTPKKMLEGQEIQLPYTFYDEDANSIKYITATFCNKKFTKAEPVAVDPVVEFVTRMYKQCLSRDPDQAGLDGWVGQLKNGQMNGAQIAEQFVFSAEMLAKNLSNEEFVNILYRAMMGREADAAGRTGWVNELNNGYLTRSEVTKCFVESTEFTNICSEYGITRGDYDASIAPIEHFVTRFYTLCLERNADQTGLYGWVNNLKNQYMNGAQIADAFIFSDEFVNKNVSDEKYVELLYNTLLGRPSDANGKAGWVGELQNGKMTRRSMMKAFIESTEFTGICEKYGITRGTVE